MIEIYDPKLRNQIVEENLRLRKNLKNKFDSTANLKIETEQQQKEFFKPVTELINNRESTENSKNDQNKIWN